MIKNPYLNAVLAGAYIVLIVHVIFYVVGTKGPDPDPDTILLPMTMITLFTLSTAVMGFLFLAQPIQLYLDGQKQEAVNFFLRTVGALAVIALIFITVLIIIAK